MAVVIGDIGLTGRLDAMCLDAEATQGILYLYKNNYTPLTSSVAGDFTLADFSGNAPLDTSNPGDDWPAAGLDGSNDAESVHAAYDFVHDGGGTDNDIYGWVFLSQAGEYIAGERFAVAPFAMDAIGKTITITLTLKLKR